ncbi:hypothetical protein L6452_28837 [Arctium lappa]|uniref:Uncharacterized protein n=1 Tax=Arctium lappa TaxID=4217 RepID=A0ACB8ZYZ4_ARCLA|nr:hypothetical protein L6452_28837 [Arctium lappa]
MNFSIITRNLEYLKGFLEVYTKSFIHSSLSPRDYFTKPYHPFTWHYQQITRHLQRLPHHPMSPCCLCLPNRNLFRLRSPSERSLMLVLGCRYVSRDCGLFRQTFSLYMNAFIPDGCHKLLDDDVVSSVEGSTKCDPEDSKLRATAILDLVFVVYVLFVLLILIVTYVVTAKIVVVQIFGTYEALPTSSVSATDSNHIPLVQFQFSPFFLGKFFR